MFPRLFGFWESYFMWFVRESFRSVSGDSTLGNSCEDLILSVFTLLKLTIVWEKALYRVLLSLTLRVVEAERSLLLKSILKIMLLCLAVFFITELYLFEPLASILIELARFGHPSISFYRYSSYMSCPSVWQWVLILSTVEFVLDKAFSDYFLRIGWRPNWYRSGRTEFTLLISRNLRFRTGLLIYFISLMPFLLFVLLSFFLELSILGVAGFFSPSYMSGRSVSLSSPYSGRLSDPDSYLLPISSKFLFVLSSWRYFP